MYQETAAHDERAIAVVGVSCRLPGGITGMDELWGALQEGRDLVTEMPADRFDTDRFLDTEMPRVGKTYTAAGGFLEEIATFDAAHFGISPKEAAHMDPQHRLLLELAAEALDDAAVAPQRLAGTDTAVYIGISDASYASLHHSNARGMNAYTMSGGASSIAANRISYTFDLRGPSMAVDTACSSSLVALDRACRTLWDGSSRTALAGGANVLLMPHHYVGFSQASLLSRRGRCASFSADADGFVRAEGGAMVLLKRLADARADGDRILGVILGSGTNCDGRTMGLSLPSAEAQEDLLRRVYAQAGVHPNELVYLEAHGTGTAVGDPLEARAIGQALGMRRFTGPLPIGSVKSNLGHLEPASGIAGLCKALLVLRHRTIPASLHSENPNPAIDFTGLGIDLVTENRALAEAARPVVGVNSFGFGGANAHVVVTAPPRQPDPGSAIRVPPEGLPVLVSARTKTALAEAAVRMATRLQGAGAEELYDIAYTSCRRRGRHEQRAVVLAATAAEGARRFTALAEGSAKESVAAAVGGRVAFVYSGNGSQWAGMAADLMAGNEVFRSAVRGVDAELAPLLGWSVADYLTLPAGQWRLAATEIAQPLLFAVQVGLTEMLRTQGVEPTVVLGHSVGEVAAAHAAGALTLAQAALVISARSRAQAATAGTGRMAAVGLAPDRAARLLTRFDGKLEIAGVNSASDVTVAGDAEALAALGKELTEQGVFFRDLGLDYAFHSRAMDAQREPLTAALKDLMQHPADIAFCSTVTGARMPGGELDANHWWDNIRRPVAFAQAVEGAVSEGADIFLEIGPHPVLRTYLRRITDERPELPTVVVPTLHRDGNGPRAMTTAREVLLAAGAHTDWSRYFPHPGRVTDLPAYPWQRERHWTVPKERLHPPLQHPLLGSRVPAPTPLWSARVQPALTPWLADHRVGGSVVLPAAGYVEMALAAGRLLFDAPAEVEHLDIHTALIVPWTDPGALTVHTSLSPDDGTLLVACTDDDAGEPRTHARARVRRLLASRPGPLPLDAWRTRCSREVTAEEHYVACEDSGLTYGPSFRVLTRLHAGAGEVLAQYTHLAPAGPYHVHPSLLDGALQAGLPLLADLVAEGQAYLPAAVDAVRVWSTPAPDGVIAVRERSRTGNEVCWDVTVADPDGTVTIRLDGCRLRRFTGSRSHPVAVQHTVLRAAPHNADTSLSPMPLPSRVLEACAARIVQARSACRELRYASFRETTSDLFARQMAAAVASLLPDPAASFTFDDLVTHGALDRHRQLWEMTAPMMERYGILDRGLDGRHTFTPAPPTTVAAHLTYTDGFPHDVISHAWIAHNGAHLADVLRGGCDPLELLVDEGVSNVVEQFYNIGPISRFYGRLARTLLEQIVSEWPEDRPLRILEVGAGTGSLTAALLPVLHPERTRYCFTDTSPFFFARARTRFAAHDFLDYRTYDLDLDPAEQGFAAGSFDLVVAGFSLHTATDLAPALRRLSGLLAPGGALLATEMHTPEVFAPLFGTLESYWSNTDTALRPHSVLLPRGQWPGLLRQCGFAHVEQTGDDQAPARDDISVLLATVATGPDRVAPEPSRPTTPDALFLVTAESETELPLAQALTGTLTSWGGRTARPVLAPDTAQAWEALLETTDGRTPAIVLLLAEKAARHPDDLVSDAVQRAETLRACVAALDRRNPGSSRARLWLVTRPSGAVESGCDIEQPADAAAWGLVRCLANEHPQTQYRRLSLARCADTGQDARRLARELWTPTDEDEIVLTRQGRFVVREQVRPSTRPASEGQSYTLEVRSPGLSYELVWKERARPRPGAGEVLIEVRAAGLNYRDVLRSTGLMPAEDAEGLASRGYGMECAGVVVAAGDGVTRFQPGDRVAGLAFASLGSHTVAPCEGLFPLPDHVTFTEGATMPVAHSTVAYSLGTLARLQPGETVLVHGAAGGVGLAAIRYATARGAKVIATAGSEIKRNYLTAHGIEHVLDSRTLAFAEHVRSLTEGLGVDVVLNSLAGEAITRGLELLRPGGRFLELGKRDFYENKPLLLKPFKSDIAFFGVNLDKVVCDPVRLAELVHLLNDPRLQDAFRPLPHSVFPAARVKDAFTLLQHSRHIGKVVVCFDPLDEPPLVEPIARTPRLDGEGTYLVTGGTGGFGAASAAWLADLGARHIALVSRRGPEAPEAERVLASLRAKGVDTTVHAADVADLAAMTAIVDGLDRQGHPLRGVVHAAMHLDDELLADLDRSRIDAVLRPKIGGAIVLDRLTRGRPCDLFLMYSSVAAVIGNYRQAPYAAGNLYLEALVRSRRRQDLPGMAVAWGMLGDTGYVARNNLADTFKQLGTRPLSPAEAFTTSQALLQADADVVSVNRVDWSRTAGLINLSASPRLAPLVPAGGKIDSGREALGSRLRRMSSSDSLTCLTESVSTLIAGVLEMDAREIDAHHRIDDYGLDSLMSTQLLVKLQNTYNIEIPPMEMLRYVGGTIADLARALHLRLGLEHGVETTLAARQDDQPESSARLPQQTQPSFRDTTPAAF
ncbi:SDR family NAD(P)-dependent oxidoreductase [Streptomyces sp. NPDC093225]|uniref:SDR family NAD(P)-dependent oxidoreductase n=1 Tax=Streptomyces sp. NPDC093225 TaxID=3366034 RepID=UPI00380C16F3